MTSEAWFTIAVITLIVIGLIRNIASTDVLMLAGVAVLLLIGVISSAQALSGFSNEGTVTVALLFVLGGAIRDTGAVHGIAHYVLGYPKNALAAQLRLTLPVTCISAFLNNTPLVAMMMPIVGSWSRRIGIPRQALFMPLSYAAILGGTCTLIGHSTNLLVAQLAHDYDATIRFGIFEQAKIGAPIALAGIAYMAIFSRWLLPKGDSQPQNPLGSREYTVSMRVLPDSIVVNKTIEEAGLRQLPGLYLVEIDRGGDVIPAPSPDHVIRSGDELLFAGIVASVVDLRNIRGLVPATNQVDKLAHARPNRRLLEAVVAAHSPLIGHSIRHSRFRTNYDAAIIAVHRSGARIKSKIGDIVLMPGDTLLLETLPTFVKTHQNNASFALISAVEGSEPVQFEKGWVALSIVAIMVVLNALGWMSLLHAVLLATLAMISTRCITFAKARRAVDIPVVLTIAASFGLAAAVSESGLARVLSDGLIGLAEPFGKLGLLCAIYLVTALLGSVITMKAAAVLVFPIAAALSVRTGIDLKSLVFVLIFAGAGNFMSPIAYQTNLMVYGPGGYRLGDFVRFGTPLQLLTAAIAIGLLV
ncbi:MAG: SLC13 family permease [Myxococcales bacterium]|nr:SLC13 family permease [Myxococcales bacterium]